ncbi:fibronectin type III domain-containing protein [Kitasatospora sp. NPDC047058]|uniref:fibronectin type III domain-containing protein n=1 Tax=Kitasatospora sp. NPDC047058 TaxID=3155620 RepID=UPI0033EA90CD
MPVTDVLTALGRWTIDLKPTTPRDVLDALVEFGHVAIVPGRVDVRTTGDNLLTAARYVGVMRTKTLADDGRTKAVGDKVTVGGVGMAAWLGDEDDKGSVIENSTQFASASFANAIRGLLPSSGAVTEGTLYSVAGTYSGTHQWESPRKAINYVCSTMSTTSVPVSWRVNGTGTLDAGPEANLFVTTPECAIVRRGAGQDMTLRALPGQLNYGQDVEDYTTRVVLLAQGEGASISTGSADINPVLNPYKDIHGNTVKLTRMVSESGTSQVNAGVRAQLALSQFVSPQRGLTLSTLDYDIDGSFSPGDYVWAYDPDKGLLDTSNEVVFRGQRINPLKLQVTEATWPVTDGHTVAYRSAAGAWTDLTDYVAFEQQGATSVVVGDFARQLTNSGTEPVGSRPTADTSIPGVPVFVTPFSGAAYLDNRGFTRSRVIITWNAPNNVDGSTVLDGDHFEIRYAVDTDLIYPATWAQLSVVRWQDLQQWRQPFAAPTGQWETVYVAWGTNSVQLQDLSPGIGYDVQIRAVDKAGNAGSWSSTTTFTATSDNIPPSTPAAPSVAGSRIALQVTHTLGKATGGTYNLESDLHHLEVHVEYEPNFTPSTTTLKGKVSATSGMIQAQIPVVTTVQVEEVSTRYVRVIAVDIAGNKSAPSTAASATALLIDDAHISDLTVTKVTAGTISADWIVGARIKTADTGARVELNASGISTYNAGGTRTFYAEAATGNVTIVGEISTATSGRRIVINPSNSGEATIRFYNTDGTDYGYINAWGTGSMANIGMQSGTHTNGRISLVKLAEDRIDFGRFSADGITSYVSAVMTDSAYFAGYDGAGGFIADSVGAYTNHESGSFLSAQSGSIYGTTPSGAYFYGDSGSFSSGVSGGYWNHNVSDTRATLVGRMQFGAQSSDQALIFDKIDFTSGSGTHSVTYGPTMSTTTLPVCTYYDGNGTLCRWQVNGFSTTGFSYATEFATGPTSIAYISFR